MEMQEVISRAERNIRQALRDYGAHTSQTDVLDDVTDEFIYRLAADSSYAKQGLRKLFSKSPVWNEELDALVINGTRTHDPDYDRIHRLAMQILEKPFKSLDYDYNDILKAVCFFSNPDASERDRESYIEAIRKLAPKAYTPTKKPSRVFKSLCVALVYLVVRSYTTFGKMDCYLYVSDYTEEWAQDRDDIKEMQPLAYVYNHDMPDCSEFGCIGIAGTPAAGLRRTW